MIGNISFAVEIRSKFFYKLICFFEFSSVFNSSLMYILRNHISYKYEVFV
jgi:hypothetical protein